MLRLTMAESMRKSISSRTAFAGRDEDGFRVENLLYLCKAVGNEGAAGGDDVKDGIGNACCGGYFHRSGDDLDLCVNALFLEPVAQDAGVGGGDALAAEPVRTVVNGALGNGQGEAAGAEAQALHKLHGETAFHYFVQSHDTQGGGAV